MATQSFPKVSAKAWSTLRIRAAASPTIRFTPEAVAALMELSSSASARKNIVRPMQQLGLIDKGGALTNRGNKWRIDDSFGDACQQILDEIYPDDLKTLIDENGHPNRKMVKTWFQQQRFGDSSARLMAATYVMVASKQLPQLPGTKPTKAKTKESPKTRPPRKPPEPRANEEPLGGGSLEPVTTPAQPVGGPTVHLNIQIHIPADAALEQIDQIFSSMAQHLHTK